MGLVTEAPYHEIIGAAMHVHNRLGPKYKGSVYQHSLTIRLCEMGLSGVVEQPMITYLAALNKSVGLLLKFGRGRLEYRRIFRPKKLEGWQDRIQRDLWKLPTHSKPPIR